jgi:hypothetical protein
LYSTDRPLIRNPNSSASPISNSESISNNSPATFEIILCLGFSCTSIYACSFPLIVSISFTG